MAKVTRSSTSTGRSGPRFTRSQRMAAVLVLLAALCASPSPTVAGQAPAASQARLRFGLSSALLDGVVSPADALAAIKMWAKEVLDPGVGSVDSDAMLFQDSASLVQAINAATVDAAGLTTMEYLSVEQSLQADPSLVYVLPEGVEVEYVLAARTGFASAQALAGRLVAVFNPSGQPDLLSTWLDVLTLESGLGGKDRAFRLQPMNRASQALLAVFFKQAAAAVVSKSSFDIAVELNPQIGKELTILAKSPPLLTGMVCIRRSLSPVVKARWVDRAVLLHQNPRTKQTLTILRAVRLDRWRPEFLDTARALLRRHAALVTGAKQ